MNNKDFCTFQFYDSQGRKVAIFGEEIKEKRIRIFVITCAKKDNFSRKVARRLYELAKLNFSGVHPQKFVLPIHETARKEFFNFAKKNYVYDRERISKIGN